MNLNESLAHHGSLEKGDFEIVEGSQLQIKEIRQGVLFVYAKWSAFSISCWQGLGSYYVQKKPSVPLFVVDADNLTPKKSVELFDEMVEGNGETFAIRDGEIVLRHSKYGSDSHESISEIICSVQ